MMKRFEAARSAAEESSIYIYIYMYIYILYIYIRLEVGGGESFVTPTGKSFRFVRACVRASGRGEARRSCVGEREAMRSV